MCANPIILKNKLKGTHGNLYTTPVPCGKCPKCTKAKTRSWLFRLKKELEISCNPLFVTLTYNEENVPYTEDGLMTLYKKDVQNFLKRLRKAYSKKSTLKIKYYLVGEYGSKTYRPHYHAIIFNLTDNELINKTWNNGFTYTPVLKNNLGVGYVLKYISKPRSNPNDGRQREFSLMSKGLGANYLTNSMFNYHKNNLENCYVTTDGFKMPLPKYYKEKLYNEEERRKVTNILKNRAIENEEKILQKYLQENPTETVKEALKTLELINLNQKFEHRNDYL